MVGLNIKIIGLIIVNLRIKKHYKGNVITPKFNKNQ